MPRTPFDRTLVACASLAVATLVLYSVRRAMTAGALADPWDVALLVALPVAAAGLLALVLARTYVAHGFSRANDDPRTADAVRHEPRAHDEVAHGFSRANDDSRSAEAMRHAPEVASEALLQFARELSASPEVDRLHATIARRLPAILGFRDLWVVTRFGARQQVIMPEGERRQGGLLADPQQWMTFPLVADDRIVGLLGVGVGQQRLTDARRRLVAEVASLLAHSLRTSDTFERMREASTVDSLTGCSTRAEGLHRIEIELRRAQRSGKPAAVLLLDLDHFKLVNDRYGHPCGDLVLAQVGRIMMQTLRASDIRCRWGGEEFLIALPETSLEPAKTVAEALRRRIAEARIVYGSDEVRVTTSVGATVTRPGETETRSLLIRVDAALYRAKNEGRNCVRAVIGDLRGDPVGAPAKPDNFLPFPDRRDPSRPDRRRIPSPGRRRTDLSALRR
jgi:diguanylate cyclase (GGDEF)-like protein